MNGIVDFYPVADFCEAIHNGACGFWGMAAQGNFNTADLISKFVALRDDPGCSVQACCDILEERFKTFCEGKQPRKWSPN